MPPRQSAKKRKAPESNQSTLDSFRLNHGARSKAASRAPASQPSTSTDTADDSSVIAASLLGSFRKQTLVDRIVIQCQGADSEPSSIPFDASWATLGVLVNAILKSHSPTTSYQEAYELCQNMCLNGFAQQLYSHLETALQTHILDEKNTLMKAAEDDTQFLTTLNTHWIALGKQMSTIRNIFMELDRSYVMRKTQDPSIIDLGKSMFRKTVMEISRIQSRTIARLLDLIELDRNGVEVDHAMMKSVIGMLLDLSLYNDYFEPGFISASNEYYEKEAVAKITAMTPQDYLKNADTRIKEETNTRIHLYLDSCTRVALNECVIHHLIHEQHEVILARGFDAMMDANEQEPLRILYTNLKDKPGQGMGHFRAAFGSYIKRRGAEMIKDPSKDGQMVVSLLQFKDKLDWLMKHVFGRDSSLLNILKESFEDFINSRNNKPAELLAKFIDGKLRAQGKKNSEENLERILDNVLVIFRYLQGKDTFEAFYKRFLSKRLLLNRSVAHDLEKSVLAKIKNECGPDFTKNLEGMFKDIEVSIDLNKAFKESKEFGEVSKNVSTFSVNVLAQGFWPSYASSDVILPAKMVELQNAYEKFYSRELKGRRLTWRNALGTCLVRGKFSKGPKELMLSQFQAIVLLLFNTADGMTYKEIATATNLDGKELKRVLQSLSCGQHKILIKEQQEASEIQDATSFSFNDAFTSDSHRLKFNSIQQEQSTEERKDTQAKVMVNRQHQLEAAIVRIMKAKKLLTHSALINELFQQLKFPLDATDVKKRIESLIDRDYLSRDEKDNSLYHYQS
ncbi:cullin 4A [Hesseltinella vesiculosa]|uniref:Cullin 4A n=1 Tax=Hesseltinella vesiculosa TaxID=101127 RepID=A0A1X2GMN4_9FUNG|nr:cullin 4A [Hesseltinella vesiculosa]